MKNPLSLSPYPEAWENLLHKHVLTKMMESRLQKASFILGTKYVNILPQVISWKSYLALNQNCVLAKLFSETKYQWEKDLQPPSPDTRMFL